MRLTARELSSLTARRVKGRVGRSIHRRPNREAVPLLSLRVANASGRAYKESMWGFRRKTVQPNVDLGRERLRGSQLAITQAYGWSTRPPATDHDLRDSAQRRIELPAADSPDPPQE
jgi:hypothetical protein